MLAFSIYAPVAMASPQYYSFSGTLTGSYDFNSNSDWNFSAGQKFHGQLGYDVDAIQDYLVYIDSIQQNLSFYYSPITSFSYTVETENGSYFYDVPLVSPNGYQISSVATGFSDGVYGLNGLSMTLSNYAINGSPDAPVPTSAFVGTYFPHSTFLTLGTYSDSPLSITASPDVNLANLFNSLDLSDYYSGQFTIRFSDPAKWPPNAERLDAVVYGKLDSLTLQTPSAPVPEPSTWLMLLSGFALAGITLRNGLLQRQPGACTKRIGLS
jgi:hypothetical protein